MQTDVLHAGMSFFMSIGDCEKGTLISDDKGKEDAAMSKYTPEKQKLVEKRGG